ncbi:MAG: hypothetical protein ACI9I0_000700 [Rhodoferax sp.]|jgi:hypothetical protein
MEFGISYLYLKKTVHANNYSLRDFKPEEMLELKRLASSWH